MTVFTIRFESEEEVFQYRHEGTLISAKKYAETKLHSDFIWLYNSIRKYSIYDGEKLIFEK